MTDKRHFGHVARLLAALFMLATTPAMAQETAPQEPMAPPERAPESRLTVTPSDFEHWLTGRPERPSDANVTDERPPGLVTPPPPPPALVTPPPPPPVLAAPPPSPTLTPPAPTQPPVATSPGTEGVPAQPGSVTPPAPPVLAPPEPPQVATLPPESRDNTPVPAPPEPLARPGEIRILYPTDATDLPKEARADLDRMAAWLRANPDVRVQIVGYASETAKAGSQARRRSLFRTLAVRTYLIENGVLSTRMDVRALGDRTDEEPKDRVEVRLPPS